MPCIINNDKILICNLSKRMGERYRPLRSAADGGLHALRGREQELLAAERSDQLQARGQPAARDRYRLCRRRNTRRVERRDVPGDLDHGGEHVLRVDRVDAGREDRQRRQREQLDAVEQREEGRLPLGERAPGFGGGRTEERVT